MLGTGEDTYHRSMPWDRYYIWNILIILGGDCPQEVEKYRGGNPLDSFTPPSRCWKGENADKLYSRFLDVVWEILSSAGRSAKTGDDAPSAFRTPHANNIWGAHFKVKEFVLVRPDKAHARFEPRQYKTKGKKWSKR